MRDARWPNGACLAEFAGAQELRMAVHALRDRGWSGLEYYAPFALDDLDQTLRYPRSRLPRAVLIGALFGAAGSYAIQWYANVYAYPLNVGGRPSHAVPAFLVATFEGTILVAALAGFFGFLVALRLPRLWHPVFEIEGFERATIDRFWLAVDQDSGPDAAESAASQLEQLGALRVIRLEPGP